MWDCEHCNCGMIAASVTACPVCGRESFGLLKYGEPHKPAPDEVVPDEAPVKTTRKGVSGG